MRVRIGKGREVGKVLVPLLALLPKKSATRFSGQRYNRATFSTASQV